MLVRWQQLSDAERLAARAVLSSEEFKDLPPSQIVTRLADKGQYVASESTMYRLLRQTGQLAHRRLEREAQRKVELMWRTDRLAPYVVAPLARTLNVRFRVIPPAAHGRQCEYEAAPGS